jgi:hypothetical protein
MEGHDPMIILPKFWGEASEDPEKHLFICEKIWEEKKITYEDTKLVQLEITLRGHALDWYMNQYQQTYPTIEDLKKDLKNLTFQLNQNKGKEKREVVWCTLCRTKEHHKNECPTFALYMATGVPNPLPTGGPWCEICKTHGHDPHHCPKRQYQKFHIAFFAKQWVMIIRIVGRWS